MSKLGRVGGWVAMTTKIIRLSKNIPLFASLRRHRAALEEDDDWNDLIERRVRFRRQNNVDIINEHIAPPPYEF